MRAKAYSRKKRRKKKREQAGLAFGHRSSGSNKLLFLLCEALISSSCDGLHTTREEAKLQLKVPLHRPSPALSPIGRSRSAVALALACQCATRFSYGTTHRPRRLKGERAKSSRVLLLPSPFFPSSLHLLVVLLLPPRLPPLAPLALWLAASLSLPPSLPLLALPCAPSLSMPPASLSRAELER